MFLESPTKDLFIEYIDLDISQVRLINTLGQLAFDLPSSSG